MSAVTRISRTCCAVIIALGLACVGCAQSLVGQWRLMRATPTREVFAVDDAAFERSGRYEATITIDGRTTRDVGTYRFTGFNLTLRPEAGGVRYYAVTMHAGWIEIGDGKRQAALRKVASTPKETSE